MDGVISIVLVVLGVAAVIWVISLQRTTPRCGRGVATTATVVDVAGERASSSRPATDAPSELSNRPRAASISPASGPRYPSTTTVTIPPRSSDVAPPSPDVTLWIVAVKLVIGGLVLLVFGAAAC